VLRNRTSAHRVEFILNNVLVLALVALIVYFTTQTDRFLDVDNARTVLENNAALAVVVVALTLLVIAGHVDLSIGSTVAFAGLIAALAAKQLGFPDVAAMALGVLAGAFIGSLNGTMCALLGFNPIIVTLGMLGVVRGATLLIKQEQVFGLGGLFHTIGAEQFIGVPNALWFTLAAFLLGALFISGTPWGRHIYAIGVNPQAAFLSALPVRWLPFWLYVATGAAAGLSGVLLTARLDGISPGDLGLQFELQALTVILLGGVAFAGGRGRLFGVLIAWLFLSTLQNGLVLMDVTPYVQMVASGLALVFAAALDALGAVLGPRLAQRRRVALQVDAVGRRNQPPPPTSADPPAAEGGGGHAPTLVTASAEKAERR
jgi:ribose/xylose/arabinose/galactoside ABC-type transport system permease subunit